MFLRLMDSALREQMIFNVPPQIMNNHIFMKTHFQGLAWKTYKKEI